MKPRYLVPAVCSAVLALTGTGVAHAGTVAGSATLVSDYVFRGVSQTNQDPAVQAGVEWAADNGFYVGTWGSNISWLSDLSADDFEISSSVESSMADTVAVRGSPVSIDISPKKPPAAVTATSPTASTATTRWSWPSASPGRC